MLMGFPSLACPCALDKVVQIGFLSYASSIWLAGTVWGTVWRRILKLGLTLQESVHDQLVMFAMDLRGVIRGTWASYL